MASNACTILHTNAVRISNGRGRIRGIDAAAISERISWIAISAFGAIRSILCAENISRDASFIGADIIEFIASDAGAINSCHTEGISDDRMLCNLAISINSQCVPKVARSASAVGLIKSEAEGISTRAFAVVKIVAEIAGSAIGYSV